MFDGDRAQSPSLRPYEDEVGELPSDAGVEDNLKVNRILALSQWSYRVMFCASIHCIISIILLFYGIVSCITLFCLAAVGLFGAKYDHMESVFVFVVFETAHAWEFMILLFVYKSAWAIILLIIDICVTPVGLYCGFYLYQTLKTDKLVHANRISRMSMSTDEESKAILRRDSFDTNRQGKVPNRYQSPNLTARTSNTDAVPPMSAPSYQSI